MAETTLHVRIREERGKQAVKLLRKEGLVPGIIYGAGEKSMELTINYKDLFTLLHTHGRNVVVNIVPEGTRKKIKAFIYEIQHNPFSGNIIHVDFKHISLKEKIHVTVPLILEGIPEGVKNEGGILEQGMHSIEISCLPMEIPEHIVVDVTHLHIGDIVHVRDIPKGAYDMLSDSESTVVHVTAPRVIVEVVEEAVVSEEVAVEPELIGKKTEEEEG